MKEVIILGIVGIAVVATILLGGTYGLRLFTEATVSVSVIDVAPGVRCAKLITTDGAAISCWKD
jgi:hypothetical protein